MAPRAARAAWALAAAWAAGPLPALGDPAAADGLEQALEQEDECSSWAASAAGGEQCTLNALQLRAAARAEDRKASRTSWLWDVFGEKKSAEETTQTTTSTTKTTTTTTTPEPTTSTTTLPTTSTTTTTVTTTSTTTSTPSLEVHASMFTCNEKWPIAAAKLNWVTYCNAAEPKVWAMDHDCTQAFYTQNATSLPAANNEAVAKCSGQGANQCYIYSKNDLACGEYPEVPLCGKQAYDNSTHGCCGTTIHPIQGYGCCDGEAYPTKKFACCGEKLVYKKMSQDCCMQNGAQIFWKATGMCCYGSGTCKKKRGQWTCCPKAWR